MSDDAAAAQVDVLARVRRDWRGWRCRRWLGSPVAQQPGMLTRWRFWWPPRRRIIPLSAPPLPGPQGAA